MSGEHRELWAAIDAAAKAHIESLGWEVLAWTSFDGRNFGWMAWKEDVTALKAHSMSRLLVMVEEWKPSRDED